MVRVIIETDLEEHYITKDEVLEMSCVLAESYPQQGTYVTSFGYLTYRIVRKEDKCEVYVTEGYGYHGLWSGYDTNLS